ncbi:MAG TPA: ABC transporter permease [Kofleriaceae bacterium]
MIKAVALLFAMLAGLSILALILYLGWALLQMAGIALFQWRDLVSLDRWQEVFSTIGRNKLRTFLTTLSVAWGIFVLVFLLGLGRGLSQGMRKSFARDAANGIWVNAGKTSVPFGGYNLDRIITFENSDLAAAKKVPGVDKLSGEHRINGSGWSQMLTRYGTRANQFEVDAVFPATLQMNMHDMHSGRFLTQADILQKSKVAVLGKSAKDFLFEAKPGEPEKAAIGEWVDIGGIAFQVVGVFTDQRGAENERTIYIPATTAQLAFNGGEKLGQLQVMVGDATPEEADRIIKEITGQLAEKHGFDPTDKQAVRVHSNIEGAAKFASMFWMISTFVVVIGLGTLAAGVVGVSNIMMIAVKERTKEIGVRKALGATPRSIVFMIIQESVFLTGVAGLLGLTGGVIALSAIDHFVKNEMIYNPSVEFSTAVTATIFLVVAGALAGYFPARAAAKVNPIHALRDS